MEGGQQRLKRAQRHYHEPDNETDYHLCRFGQIKGRCRSFQTKHPLRRNSYTRKSMESAWQFGSQAEQQGHSYRNTPLSFGYRAPQYALRKNPASSLLWSYAGINRSFQSQSYEGRGRRPR